MNKIFPIPTQTAIDAYVWMRDNLETTSKDEMSPDLREGELIRFRKKQPIFFLFLNQMKYLRGATMFSSDNETSYENGIIFMMRTFQNNFRQSGQVFPELSAASLSGYFQNLIDVENNHFAIEQLIKTQGIINRQTPLLPSTLASIALDTNAQTPELLRVKETFRLNSEFMARDLCDGEDLGGIMHRGDVANKFGPIMGFTYGATDVYGAIKYFEEGKAWRNILRIETK